MKTKEVIQGVLVFCRPVKSHLVRYVSFSDHNQGSIDLNTFNTYCPVGIDFLIHPWAPVGMDY